MSNLMVRRPRGVTLVELLVVVAIVAVLAAFFVPRYLGYRQQAADSRVIDLLNHIRQGTTAYEAKYGGFYLPCGWGDQYNNLRNALYEFIRLPYEGEMWELATNFVTCYIGWSDSWAYATMMWPRDGQGPAFIAVQSGVYRCDGWIWNCRRP
jgi:prepilin-type N-terminal cleavage/methylation domain-containing protein